MGPSLANLCRARRNGIFIPACHRRFAAFSRLRMRPSLKGHNWMGTSFDDPNQHFSITKRTFSWGVLPTVLIPPVVFLGLALTLWAYKCGMMVIFQNKIIYMPYLPPFARHEKIEDYARLCEPVVWEERRIKSLDGVDLALCIGSVAAKDRMKNARLSEFVILYLQGNASSLPPRLPTLSNVMKSLNARVKGDENPRSYTIVALSYRGYWTSRGRPSERGIQKDSIAALQWIDQTFRQAGTETKILVWGQSVGAGVATCAIASYLEKSHSTPSKSTNIRGLILETPFVSIRDMLTVLYPQKWLPYRYLWPFLRNRWDSERALRRIASMPGDNRFPILMLSAGKDELVPPEQADKLHSLALELGLDVERTSVQGALHNEATVRHQGRQAVVAFLDRLGRGQA